jgi:hypothetical protein
MSNVTPITREELQGAKAAADNAALDKKVAEGVNLIYYKIRSKAATSEDRTSRFQIVDVSSKIGYFHDQFSTTSWNDDPNAPTSFFVGDGKFQTKAISKEMAERFREELAIVFPGCGVSFDGIPLSVWCNCPKRVSDWPRLYTRLYLHSGLVVRRKLSKKPKAFFLHVVKMSSVVVAAMTIYTIVGAASEHVAAALPCDDCNKALKSCKETSYRNKKGRRLFLCSDCERVRNRKRCT